LVTGGASVREIECSARWLCEVGRLPIGEKAYEDDHPALATSYNNLAYVEQDLSNMAEARRLMRRAYEIWRAKLGAEHPHTKKSADWLRRHDPDFQDS
jgi:hypothetical protein